MSTLSLAELSPNMRKQLGLAPTCPCAARRRYAASIPVIETIRRPDAAPVASDPPGAAWLKTGLHRLRVPAVAAQDRAAP